MTSFLLFDVERIRLSCLVFKISFKFRSFLPFLVRRSLGTDRIVTAKATTVTPNHLTAEEAQINPALDLFLNAYLFKHSTQVLEKKV